MHVTFNIYVEFSGNFRPKKILPNFGHKFPEVTQKKLKNFCDFSVCVCQMWINHIEFYIHKPQQIQDYTNPQSRFFIDKKCGVWELKKGELFCKNKPKIRKKFYNDKKFDYTIDTRKIQFEKYISFYGKVFNDCGLSAISIRTITLYENIGFSNFQSSSVTTKIELPYFSKIVILVKNWNLVKNRNFGQTSDLWSNIRLFVKNWNFGQTNFLGEKVKNGNGAQNRT